MLNTILSHNYTLIQSSIIQTAVPLLNQLIVAHAQSSNGCLLLVCLAYPPSVLLGDLPTELSDSIHVLDFTSLVPEFTDDGDADDIQQRILTFWGKWSSNPGNVTLVIDAVHYLLTGAQTPSSVVLFLRRLLKSISESRSAKLVLHILKPSPLISHLTSTSLSHSLCYLKSFPTLLISKISSEYLVTPPQEMEEEERQTSTSKFWSIFIPISERDRELEQFIFSSSSSSSATTTFGSGPGPGSGDPSQFIVEIIMRNTPSSKQKNNGSHKRSLDRQIVGWSIQQGGYCSLRDIPSLTATLKSLQSHTLDQVAEEPTAAHQTSFNLQLTESQQKARASVPQPYAHEGKPTIFYDYDSADDHDEDDPDEDLDI